MDIKRTVTVLTAIAVAAACSGCSSGRSEDRKETKRNNTSSVAEEIEETESSGTDDLDTDAPTAKDGAHIMELYSFLQQDDYRIRLRYTDSQGRVTYITESFRDGSRHIVQENEAGTNGYISKDGDSFDYDLLCGIYRRNTRGAPESMIRSAVEQELPMTSACIDEDLAEIYDSEEYTYTGDTYITVMDLYFDRDTGLPVVYTVTYMTEGRDEIVETREFLELSASQCFAGGNIPDEESSEEDSSGTEESSELEVNSEPEDSSDNEESSGTDEDSSGTDDDSSEVGDSSAADDIPEDEPVQEGYSLPQITDGPDESVFDMTFLDQLADFDAMTEERRMGYCEAILMTAGISYEDAEAAGITLEELKTISYDAFTSLVYSLK